MRVKFVLTMIVTVAIALGTVVEAEAHSKSNIRKLDRYLANTPMRGTGQVLDHQGHLYGVSPFFIAAVAGKESSFGSRACYNNPKNVWGLGQCGRVWPVPYFRTWTEAINFFVRFIEGKTPVTRGWPNATSPYHFSGYCAGCEYSWASGITSIMSGMGTRALVTYHSGTGD